MIWNYRAIRYNTRPNRVGWLAIHTIYYSDSGQIISYNLDPESCGAETIADLQLKADMMRAACELRILPKDELDREVAKQRRRTERRSTRGLSRR